MIDIQARNRLFQQRQNDRLVQTIQQNVPVIPEVDNTPFEQLNKTSSNQTLLSGVSLTILRKITDLISKIFNQMPSKDDVSTINQTIKEMVLPTFPDQVTLNAEQVNSLIQSIKEIPVPEIPSEITVKNIDLVVKQFMPLLKALEALKAAPIQQITGTVEVLNPAPQADLSPLLGAINQLRLDVVRMKPTETKQTQIDLNPLLSSIEGLKEGIQILVDKKQDFPTNISVDNFPKQLVTPPVTHVSINSLNGFVKATAVTVTSALTPLPGEVLANRRSVIIYNNGSQTMEVGGSTFAFGGGMPVPASSYSPPIDAGSRLIFYGRVASGSVDCRVLEISDIAAGV